MDDLIEPLDAPTASSRYRAICDAFWKEQVSLETERKRKAKIAAEWAESGHALLVAVNELLRHYDPETGIIDVSPEPSCQECTAGTTPGRFDEGPCAFDRLQSAVARAEAIEGEK